MEIAKENSEGILLSVYIQPRASCNQVVGVHGGSLKIKLTAPPVDNAANQMCIQFLTKCLGLPKSAAKIVSGHTSRHKKLLIRPQQGKTPALKTADLKAKINALLEGK